MREAYFDQSNDSPGIDASYNAKMTSLEEQEYHKAQSVHQLTEQNVKLIADLENASQAQKTGTDRAADAITHFCGSMIFVWVHVVWFVAWVVANTLPGLKHIDPFPFNFLTLVVSLEAIFLSTFILISENRQSRVDERRSHLDLQINLLSEQENTKMLQLLKEIADKLGVDSSRDPTVSVLEQATRPEKLVEQIDGTVAKSQQDKKA